CTSIAPVPMPPAANAATAPSTSFFTIASLKRAATTAKRAFRPPCGCERGTGARPAMRSVRERRQLVTELVALRVEIFPIGVVRGNLDRHALDDGEAVALEPHALARIVREQSQILDAEVDEHLRADAVVPWIGREPQRDVRLDRVHPAILELVGAHLVD